MSQYQKVCDAKAKAVAAEQGGTVGDLNGTTQRAMPSQTPAGSRDLSGNSSAKTPATGPATKDM